MSEEKELIERCIALMEDTVEKMKSLDNKLGKLKGRVRSLEKLTDRIK